MTTTTLPRPAPERRYAALALTALVHVILLFGWLSTRRVPAPPAGAEPERIQWIDLRPRAPILPRPAPVPEPRPAPPAPAHAPERAPERAPAPVHMPAREAVAPSLPAAAPSPQAAQASQPSQPSQAPSATVYSAAPAPGPSAADLLERAKREIGGIDKALRKENKAYIVAPPDSPEMRMRRGMEAAHDMTPPKLWEAPKIAELVNNTGDGTRHTRVITGNGTYCINERPPTASIDTIEKLGKVTPHLTCPKHETPAGSQEWKTGRDP